MASILNYVIDIVATPGSTVLIKNTKVFCREQWETAVVDSIECIFIPGVTLTRYNVTLTRAGANGKGIRRTVSGSHIKPHNSNEKKES